jgi:hypothetical protein
MTGLVTVWAAIGVATGAAHAAALWRSAQRRGLVAWSAAFRLPLLGAVLVAAAFARALLPAVGGWMVGLIVTGGALLVLRHER